MRLIVGLGNPGEEYRDTRHNLGYRLLDLLCRRNGCRKERPEGPCRVRPTRLGPVPLWLVRTGTYMNTSGPPVRTLMERREAGLEDLLVAYDEVDLELGQIKVRRGGGTAGHRGIESICRALGSDAFPRLRLGIGRPRRGRDLADWVLEPFRRSEEPRVEEMMVRAAEAAECWATEGVEAAMNGFNLWPLPETETS